MSRSNAAAHPWEEYYRACLEQPVAVGRVERHLDGANGKRLSLRDVADALGAYGVTYDQVARVLGALRVAGAVVTEAHGTFIIAANPYLESRALRVAALDALSWAGAQPDRLGECELLLAAPADAASIAGHGHERQFSDLRTTVRSLVAEAQQRVLLAAPYWDVDVAVDLASVLRRRQDAGVRVAILSRRPQRGSANEQALVAMREILLSGSLIHVLERPSPGDPFGSSTFHFKAASADGIRVYLGSANFNTAGFGSRWELGVRLGGRRALVVSELLETLLQASSPF